MFKVTAVSYVCYDGNTEERQASMIITEAETSSAPMPELPHPIDRWWVRSGVQYRTPLMTGTPVYAV